MMMYEGLCFAQWSMTPMSNAPFGCLASLHFSAFCFNAPPIGILRGLVGGGEERRKRRGEERRVSMALGSGEGED